MVRHCCEEVREEWDCAFICLRVFCSQPPGFIPDGVNVLDSAGIETSDNSLLRASE